MSVVQSRLSALDNKQAIHLANKLVETAFLTAPELRNLDEAEKLSLVETGTGLNLTDSDEEIPSDEAGAMARCTLQVLASLPGGEELINTALDSWFDTTADFGLLTRTTAAALLWIVSSTEIDFTLGTLHFHKPALNGDQQQALNKALGLSLAVTEPSFRDWAGSDRVTLAIVFTDIVGSTALGEALKDEAIRKLRADHFTQSRRLIAESGGFEVKTIGDSFMVVFKSVDRALDYALHLWQQTGHAAVAIRAGIHIGALDVEGCDVFGGEVNYASRVVAAIQDSEIWVSDPVKKDIDRFGPARFAGIQWEERPSMKMKGFDGTYTLWRVLSR